MEHIGLPAQYHYDTIRTPPVASNALGFSTITFCSQNEIGSQVTSFARRNHQNSNSAIKMRVTKHEFELFLANRGNYYPYNSIRTTRNGIYPRWILLESRQPHLLFCNNGFHLTPTACLSNETMQEMIVIDKAIPLPSDYDDIAFCMEYWGRGVCGLWQQQVLSVAHSFLSEGEHLPKKYLYYEMIYLLVERKVDSFFLHHDIRCAIKDGFARYFNKTFESETNDFFHLAVRSIQYCDNLIHLNRDPAERAGFYANVQEFVRGSAENPVVLG
jgi:hypothetical protein